MEEIRLPIGEGENQPSNKIDWRIRKTDGDMLLEEVAIIEPGQGRSRDSPRSSRTD
jgi:hypothetical protein